MSTTLGADRFTGLPDEEPSKKPSSRSKRTDSRSMLTALDEADHVRGASGPHVILEYGDYECPYSRQAFRSIRQLMKLEPARGVRFVFRHFPLIEFHPHSLAAARAAEAAALQGRFWEMHELLFYRQPLLGDDHLRDYARELGLDEARFARDRFGSETLARVLRDVERAKETGEVAGTPTFFIDGVVHRGAYDVDSLREAIA
jgi:protein-disulfide isomerase